VNSLRPEKKEIVGNFRMKALLSAESPRLLGWQRERSSAIPLRQWTSVFGRRGAGVNPVLMGWPPRGSTHSALTACGMVLFARARRPRSRLTAR
jgi:hypothetical protein